MRLIWLDYLRVIAAFAVVCTHVSSIYFSAYHQLDSAEWWYANIVNASSRFAVPIFIMISGCLLLGRDYSLAEFYGKRIKRIVPPLIFWSILFAVLNYHLYGLPGFVQAEEGARTDWLIILEDMLLLMLITGSTAVHLWYLSMLACLLLFVPFINKFITGKPADLGDMLALIGLGILFTGLNLAAGMANDLAGITVDWFTRFPWYMLYLVLGYLIFRYKDALAIAPVVFVIAFCALVFMGAIANFQIVSTYSVIKDWLVLSNDGVVTFAVTLSVFIIFAKNSHRFSETRLISSLSEASFGIYLVHPVFILLFQKLFTAHLQNAWLFLTLMILLTFFCSYLAIVLMRRVRWLKVVC